MVSENVYEVDAPEGTYVTVEYQDIKLTARHVRADRERKLVVAEGDVVFEQGASRLTGVRLDLDLTDKVGVLTDGVADLEGGMHLKGARLAKVGPRTFTIADGSITACEGPKPSWYFSVEEGRVTMQEYARLRKVVFRLGGVPLLYTPYLLWPAMSQRMSGFLIPGIGYNSDRGGYLGLSYFQTLGRSADATVSADIYTKQYFGGGIELRAQPSVGTRMEGVFYAVNKPATDSAPVEAGWQWKTLGRVVSDDLAPRTRGVVTWLNFSDIDFFQSYDRDFTLTSTRTVGSSAFVTRTEGPFAFNFRLERQEALFGTSSVLTERIPTLEARLRPTAILGQRVFLEAQGQAGLLHTDRGANQPVGTYGRFDLFPKVSAPLSPLPWFSLDATVGGRVTSYGKSLSPDGTSLLDESYVRTYGVVGLNATGPSFSRIFDGGLGPWVKLKHLIEPRVSYDYVSTPSDYVKAPLIDEVDAFAPTHTLRYSLVQRLLGKDKTGGTREVASLELARTYYFNIPGEGTPSGPNPYFNRNSPLDATLRVSAGQALSFDARTSYDFTEGRPTSSSVSANLMAGESSLALSYYDSRPAGTPAPEPSAQLRVAGGTPIVKKRLRLDVMANYDVSQGRMLESRSLLTVEASCFKILMEYRDLRIGTLPARDFRIALNLKNVGSFLDFTGSLSR